MLVIDGIGNVPGRHPAPDRASSRAPTSRARTRRAGSTVPWVSLYALQVARTLGGRSEWDLPVDSRHRRRGRPLWIVHRQPIVLRPADRTGDRRAHQPLRRDAAQGGARARGLAGRPRGSSIRAATGAISRRISSRATRSRAAASRWASSPASSRSGSTGSSSKARRTMPGQHGWRSARMRAWRSSVSPPRSTALSEVAGPRTVWTTGRITLDPGAPSIIPGGAEMLFQFRDADPERLALLQRSLEELVAEADGRGPCRCRLEVVSQSVPKVMAEPFQDALERAAEQHAPGLHVRMPSGAGHDAQILARIMPPGCCSCRASAESAITGPRTRRTRTSFWAARSWPPLPRPSSGADRSEEAGSDRRGRLSLDHPYLGGP